MLSEDQRIQMMYAGTAICFNGERGLGWSRSQLLTVINVSALPVFVATTSIDLRYVIAIIGVVLNAGWYLVNQRSRRRINYWQNCLARMEPPESYLLVFRIFTGSASGATKKTPLPFTLHLFYSLFF